MFTILYLNSQGDLFCSTYVLRQSLISPCCALIQCFSVTCVINVNMQSHSYKTYAIVVEGHDFDLIQIVTTPNMRALGRK